MFIINLNEAYKFCSAMTTTLWMPAMFIAKQNFTFGLDVDPLFVFLGMIGIIFLLSWLCCYLTKFMGKSNMIGCREISRIDGTYFAFIMPFTISYIYGAVINNAVPLLVAFLMITWLVYRLPCHYFNLGYLLAGYRYYKVKTNAGNVLTIISKKPLRRYQNTEFELDNLRRIDDWTFVNMDPKYEI